MPLAFDPPRFSDAASDLRLEVREFARAETAAGRLQPTHNGWITPDPDFSRRLGTAGYVGMTIPPDHAGHGRSPLERFVVIEELLAAGAPMGAHWIADRQSAPQILAHGSDRARADILPRIAAGECYFGIGMSEPGAGSDLAAVATRAVPVDGGYAITGSKLWTSNARIAHYLIVLARTSPPEGRNRHAGLTQFIVDTGSPGIEIHPIEDLSGRQDFNQVFFDDVFVPADMRLGAEGQGWALVTGELAYERSGPERILSNLGLLRAAVAAKKDNADRADRAEIGRAIAHLAALRRMSGSIAGMLDAGKRPNAEAALVKDLGTRFEQTLPDTVRRLLDQPDIDPALAEIYRDVVLTAPSYTLRGGTNEILRGIIARDLGLR